MGNILSLTCQCDVTRCWDSIPGQEPYVRDLEENLQTLDSSLQQLIALKNDVNRRVVVGEQQPFMKRLDEVQNWISSVETVETQVNQVARHGAEEIEKLCCGGYCSKHYISSYKFGENVAKKLVELSDLKSKGDFRDVVEECLPEGLVHERPLEPPVGMELMFEKVWRHVKDNEVGIIGLYGMGGVGKTTLLKQVNNNFQRTRTDFNLVIWVVVSRNLKLENIQDTIANEIRIFDDRWRTKAQHEKAQQICRVLSKKRFLLFLDDIWEQVELGEVGVPFPNERNKSMIVFTTRSEDVCGYMGAHKKIKVECLAWDKAWNLFEEMVGEETLSIHPDIPQRAEMVAKECGGLPLALKIVGRAMAC